MFGNHRNDNLVVSITSVRAEELLDAVPQSVRAEADPSSGEVVFHVAGAEIVRSGSRWEVRGPQTVVAALALRSNLEGVEHIRDFYTDPESSSA